MHAVAENSSSTIATENGTTKLNKKKNRNHKKQQSQQKNSEPAPPQDDHNVSTGKVLNHSTKNGTIGHVSNGQIKDKSSNKKSNVECADIKVNGCAKNDHHEVENGEVTAVSSSKKSRSRNQRKKRQKSAQNILENGEDKIDEAPSSMEKESTEIMTSNNNNIGDKVLLNEQSVAANGTESCPGTLSEKNHIRESINETSPPTSPESKPQSKSSTSSSNSAQSSSSSTPAISSSPSLPSPQPSTSREEGLPSSSQEQCSSSSPENQGLGLGAIKKQPVAAAASPAKEPIAGPSEEEGAVGGIDRNNIVIEYKQYESELQMQDIMRLIQSELSEPYSIYTYRYFIYNWPKLCFLAAHGDEYVGAIVCKLDMHINVRRGYIAMLAVKREYRKMKIGTTLVEKAIEAMLEDGADEVVLETEMKNTPALRLYENLGFVRDKRLFRYYLNGVDALRLKLWFR